MAKVTSKLQVTIPKTIAEEYGIRPGSEIRWMPAGDAIRVEPVASGSPSGISQEKRLALFDRMTARIDQLPSIKPHRAATERGWRREDLYSDRLKRYARPRRY